MLLANWQAEFAETIFSEQPKNCYYQIYQNNWQRALTKTLENIYPYVKALLGEAYFIFICKEYIKAYPSRSSNLNEYGAYFSEFLLHYSDLQNLIYLPEVAKFEWQCHLLHFSENFEVNINSINDDTADQTDASFILNPSLVLMNCEFPLIEIINLCKTNSDEEVNLDQGGVYLAVYRPQWDVIYLQLSEEEFLLLKQLQQHEDVSLKELEALNANAFGLVNKFLQYQLGVLG